MDLYNRCHYCTKTASGSDLYQSPCESQSEWYRELKRLLLTNRLDIRAGVEIISERWLSVYAE